MQDNNDIPRLPDEDVVDRSSDIPDVARDDERQHPGSDERYQDDDDEMDEAEADDRGDLDPQMTD
jgi:hypothetical protein